MSIVNRPTLTPAMLLFEVAAMASRHGLAVSTDNPSASLHFAEQLMRSLGLIAPAEPAAIEAAATTTELPRIPPGPGFLDVALPRGADNGKPQRPHPLDRPTDFRRGTHRPGAERTLRPVN